MQYKDYHIVDLAGGNHTVDLADWYLGFGNPVVLGFRNPVMGWKLFCTKFEKIRLHVAMARAMRDRKNRKLMEILAYV
ncbi:hypothetical protein E3N88_45401 [Mikania micrantha]|uniref:Uncharacterized protein n=1 Tax=Mikania micrantha TaxID=192012 RepID=A0A5N6L997_9ASTR|nr:hypothetical protein E3N88_45401 [Mikania micrantha]